MPEFSINTRRDFAFYRNGNKEIVQFGIDSVKL
jgi:hypothetical protein